MNVFLPRSRSRSLASSLSAWALISLGACTEVGETPAEQLSGLQQGLSVCNETVPPDRFIDGIPAYAQCAEVANSAVYSNDGVETSTTKLGADWHRTQWSGGYQCTELATRYLHFKWGVDYVPREDAGRWCDSEPPSGSGVVKTTVPVHGDLMVLAPGSCGASPSTGHVNVVDTVDMARGSLVAVEQNRARRGTYQIDCATCFLHVVANDGSGLGGPDLDGGITTADAGEPMPDAANTDQDGGEVEEEEVDAAAEWGAAAPEGGAAEQEEIDAGASQDTGPMNPPNYDNEEAGDGEVPDAFAPSAASEGGCAVGSATRPDLTFALLLLLALLSRRAPARA